MKTAIIWISISIGIGLIIAYQSPKSTPPAKHSGASQDQRRAEIAAKRLVDGLRHNSERFVKTKLKAPATAKFEHGDVRGPDKENNYFAFGKVHAHNSFGALIVNDYAVKAKMVCGDAWKRDCWNLIGVEVAPRR